MIKDAIAEGSVHACKFILRFVIKHPTLSCDAISSEFGLEPHSGHTVGECRKTPTGRVLEGTWQDTFWGFNPCVDGQSNFFDVAVEFARSISQHSEFLLNLSKSGGRVGLNVDLFGAKNIGDVIKPDGMALLASLGITLGVEVFPQGAGPGPAIGHL